MNRLADDDDRGFLAALIGDGRPLLSLTAMALILSGGFALFLSATGHFLPHDVQHLGLTPAQLCERGHCRIVHFMFHDRASFGGALIAIGTLYLWLAEFPLQRGEPWAWWLFIVSGTTGFGSFLAYLGYGYLDSWHGAATLVLLPLFVLGLVQTRRALDRPAPLSTLWQPGEWSSWRSAAGVGRACLLATGAGMMLAGGTILVVGMTRVFVPQDLEYMQLTADDLDAISPRLVPLIAHDRAGFGGGLGSCGLILFLCVWCGRPARHLWQALAIAGTTGFVTAIGVHPFIGYMSLSHLAPACMGAMLFFAGLALSRRPMGFRSQSM